MTKSEAGYYLAGLIDGEGTVTYDSRWGTREIWIYNNDIDLIDATVECCNTLDIACTTAKVRTRPGSYTLRISQRHNLELVALWCPLRSFKKKSTLIEALGSYKQLGYMARKVSNLKGHNA